MPERPSDLIKYRVDDHQTKIEDHETRIDSLESKFDNQDGVLKALRVASLILGIIAAIFTLLRVLDSIPATP